MKYLFIILLPFTILNTSCNSAKKKTTEYKDVFIEEEETDFGITEETVTDEFTTDDFIELNSDSLALIYAELELEYNSQKQIFESNRNRYYKLKYEYSGIYEIITETWYFDSLFNLINYDYNVGAEGGYESNVFQVYNGELLVFHSMNEETIDMKNNSLIQYRPNGEALKSIHFSEKEDNRYSSLFVNNNFNDYKIRLTTLDKKDFTFNETYNYSYYEEIKSEYGGTESVGYSITIDSLLLNHLDF